MSALAALFERHRLRAVVDAAVEGRLGSVTSDHPERPSVARLSLGCYAIVGGDPGHGSARELLEAVEPPREIVYGNDAAWRRLVLEVHGARVSDRPMRLFDASRLDRSTLARLASTCPPEYRLTRMDASHACQLDRELEPHALQVFGGPEHFAREGFGYGIVTPDGTLACAATSYTVSSRHMEVAIATRVAHRGHGLAAIAAAALMVHSLDAGLEPAWSASNPVSKRLAERLGYVPADECEVLLLA